MAQLTGIYLFILLGFPIVITQLWQNKQMLMFFEKFENCPDYNNYTSVVRNAKISSVGNMMHVNYETHILKDSRGVLEMVWEIQRCSSKEQLDTCIMFNKMRTSHFCTMIASKGEAWSPYVSCLKPKMTCPLRKGVYRGKNCTIDAAAFKFFPLQGAYWKFRSKILERQAIRMCIDIFGYIKEH